MNRKSNRVVCFKSILGCTRMCADTGTELPPARTTGRVAAHLKADLACACSNVHCRNVAQHTAATCCICHTRLEVCIKLHQNTRGSTYCMHLMNCRTSSVHVGHLREGAPCMSGACCLAQTDDNCICQPAVEILASFQG